MFPITARFIPFLVVAVTLVVAPGPDFAMVTRNVLHGGRSAGLMTAMGVATGTAVWTLASVVGIAELLRLSTVAFTLIKLAGAAYLLYLGLRMLLSSIGVGKKQTDRDNAGRRTCTALPARAAYRQGLVCNLLNPKAAAIFTSVIPQFLTPGGSPGVRLAGLGLVFVLLVATWLSVYSFIAGRLSEVLRQSRVKRALDGLTGCVLVGFGLRVAAEW